MSSRDSIAFRIERLIAVALLGLTSAFVNDALAGAAPQEPSVILDTTAVPPTGKTIPVAAGGDLQGALNSAQPGDVVEIAAGATFTGNFVLPAKSGADSTHWVLIRSSAFASLPAAGSRVAPSNASSMAKIQTSNTAPSARLRERREVLPTTGNRDHDDLVGSHGHTVRAGHPRHGKRRQHECNDDVRPTHGRGVRSLLRARDADGQRAPGHPDQQRPHCRGRFLHLGHPRSRR